MMGLLAGSSSAGPAAPERGGDVSSDAAVVWRTAQYTAAHAAVLFTSGYRSSLRYNDLDTADYYSHLAFNSNKFEICERCFSKKAAFGCILSELSPKFQ